MYLWKTLGGICLLVAGILLLTGFQPYFPKWDTFSQGVALRYCEQAFSLFYAPKVQNVNNPGILSGG
jgi:hypothetical protein